MNINRQNKGITLVALVVTIIVLIILAGITITQLTGNGLLGQAKQAKEQYQESEAEESLQLELTNILIGQSGNKNLDDLDGMVIQGYETNVSSAGKIITMTKGNSSYYFLVDSEFNITSLNDIGISGSAPSGGTGDTNPGTGNTNPGTGDVNQGTSELITQANLVIESINSMSVKLKIEIPESELENVAGYQILVNNKVKKVSEDNEMTITDLTKLTQYNIVAVVIDTDGNIKKSNEENITTTNCTYLYNRGDYSTELTGGWKYSGGYSPNSSHWTKYEDYMQISCPQYTRTYITTKNAIDLTNYSALTIICEKSGGSPNGYITTSSTVTQDPSNFNITSERTVIDISNYTGNQYIHLSASNGTLKIYEVYLDE